MFSTVTLQKNGWGILQRLARGRHAGSLQKYRNFGIAAAVIVIAFVGHWELTIPAEFKVLARNESAYVRKPRASSSRCWFAKAATWRKAKCWPACAISKSSNDFRDRPATSKPNARARAAARRRASRGSGSKQRLVETKRMELSNARRNQEQRNQLTQTLERKNPSCSWISKR